MLFDLSVLIQLLIIAVACQGFKIRNSAHKPRISRIYHNHLEKDHVNNDSHKLPSNLKFTLKKDAVDAITRLATGGLVAGAVNVMGATVALAEEESKKNPNVFFDISIDGMVTVNFWKC